MTEASREGKGRGDNDARLPRLKGICGKTSPRVCPRSRYLALHKSAENGELWVSAQFNNAHFLSSVATRRPTSRSPFSLPSILPSSRDPLFPAASRMAFFLCPVEPLRDPPATIRMRYIIKYFCVRAAGDNRGS